MAKFRYSALKNNKIVNGEIEARNINEARRKLISSGFIVRKISSDNDTITQVENTGGIEFLSLSEKISFTSEMQTMLSSGIPILESLETIKNNAPNKKLKKVCGSIQNLIQNGKNFSQAIQILYYNAFGDIYISIAKAGETSGELDMAMDRILTLLRKQETTKSKVINALIYPIVLILMMFGLALIFSKFVFPKIMGAILYNTGNIPPLTKALINTFDFVSAFWWALVLGFIIIVWTITVLFRKPEIKKIWDKFILSIPAVKNFVLFANLSNFMTALYVSYESGMPIATGIELACKTLGNYTLKSRFDYVKELIKNGKPVSEAFRSSDIIPPAINTIIASGEKSGTLGKKFNEAADVLDKKVDFALDVLLKLFEPTLIVIMGIIVFIIALAIIPAVSGAFGGML